MAPTRTAKLKVVCDDRKTSSKRRRISTKGTRKYFTVRPYECIGLVSLARGEACLLDAPPGLAMTPHMSRQRMPGAAL